MVPLIFDADVILSYNMKHHASDFIFCNILLSFFFFLLFVKFHVIQLTVGREWTRIY